MTMLEILAGSVSTDQLVRLVLLDEMLARESDTETAIRLAISAAEFVLGHQQDQIIAEFRPQIIEPHLDEPPAGGGFSGCGDDRRSEGGLIDPPGESDEGGHARVSLSPSEQSEAEPQPAHDEIPGETTETPKQEAVGETDKGGEQVESLQPDAELNELWQQLKDRGHTLMRAPPGTRGPLQFMLDNPEFRMARAEVVSRARMIINLERPISREAAE